jgi:hypothetical protein
MNHLETEKEKEYLDNLLSKVLLFSPDKMSVVAVRIFDSFPRNFRWFVKTSGFPDDGIFHEAPILQGQYFWTQGTLSGSEWRDVPTVYEGENE